jgi:hypothetical protein
MGPGLIALFVAAGSGTWIYTKFMRKTGNNAQTAAIAAGTAGLLIFIITFFIFNAINGS